MTRYDGGGGSEKVGPDKKKIRDYVETKITNWPGTGGVFKMSPNDHCGWIKIRWI